MVKAALDGFLLGASLIVAIGAQNAFVLREGLRRAHIFVVCLICALADAILIAGGVGGLGILVRRTPHLLAAVTGAGALFLFAYGLRAFRRATGPRVLEPGAGGSETLARVVATCLALTFLNPHVYLDTVLLLGALSGRYAGVARAAYGLGAAAASFVWFFSLGYGARLLEPLFSAPAAWRVLDVIIGGVMWALAAGLAARLLA